MNSNSIWRNRRFLFYAAGNSINNIGNSLYAFALPLLIYSLTGSAISMGLMMCLELAPYLLSPFIGTFVDRYSRRTVIFLALGLQAFFSLLIPTLHALGVLEIWMIYVIGTCITFGFVLLSTAQLAVIPKMFPDQRVEARAALTTCYTVTTILGPTLAGLLIQHVDYYRLLLLDSFTYLAPILLCIWSRIPHEQLGGLTSAKQVWQETRAGLTYVVKHPVIRNITLSSIVTGLASDAGFLIVLMYYLKDELLMSDRIVSWMLVVQGVGLFLGSLVPAYTKHLNQGRLLIVLTVLVFLTCSLFFVRVWWVVPIAVFLYSLTRLATGSIGGILLQENAPSDLLGRTIGSMRLVIATTTMISPLLLGNILERFGSNAAFAFLVGVLILSAIIIASGPLNPRRQALRQKSLPTH